MFENMYYGFLVGLGTSVPVGPIALLCIQRTLQKGRWHGFFSGLGAATSDFLYALIAVFGLSFVMDFVHQHQFYIQIVGSALIMAFGVYIFFQNPSKNLKKTDKKQNSYWQDYLTAFGLTITNPLMIFLFLGVFARFGFLDGVCLPIDYVLGMSSVFLGSSTWWFCLTMVASIFHKRINVRGLWYINKITGVLIFLLALGGLLMTLNGQSVSAL